MRETVSEGAPLEAEEHLAALRTNIEAVSVVTDAVRGTLGPKGLDVLLMDGAGGVIITNDGATILQNLDISHPVADLMLRLAQSQDDEVGDGTTTVTVLAGALVRAGWSQVERGVPVNRVLEGMESAWRWAIQELQRQAHPVTGPADPALYKTALIAARGQADIARLAVEAAQSVGEGPLLDGSCRLMETIVAQVDGAQEVIPGLVVERGRSLYTGPTQIREAKILILDDELAPAEVADKALASEAGFAEYLSQQQQFRSSLQKLSQCQVDVVLLNRGADDAAQEALADLGIVLIERVPHRVLQAVGRHTGGRLTRRGVLERSTDELQKVTGRADMVSFDDTEQTVRIVGGAAEPAVTILVTAATQEVLDERYRITRDAAGAVQAAVRSGLVPGGGAVEIGLARFLQGQRSRLKPLQAYGLDSCVEALKAPLAQIAENAGFNRLEKVEAVVAAQDSADASSIGMDCDTGQLVDLVQTGILDPLAVKVHGMQAAFEIARAVLRISRILRKRTRGVDSQA